ncbi:MAG: ComF family protein [Syntrophomonadaceae bacterium]
MLDPILDVLFPQGACCICRKPGRYGCRQPWCQECLDTMINLQQSGSNCAKCGKYLAEGAALCSDCKSKPPPFDIARAVGPYEDPYRITTKVLKFMGRKYLAPQMGRMMAQKIRSEPGFGPIDMIVPVPISRNSLQVRGFNQTELLARKIGKELGIKTECGVLVRTKETPHQTDLSKEERERNLACVFQVSDPDKVKGKNILLVDDVYTTGATSKECTRALLDAGAARVCVITWATGRGF